MKDCEHEWVLVNQDNYFRAYVCKKCGDRKIEAKGANE